MATPQDVKPEADNAVREGPLSVSADNVEIFNIPLEPLQLYRIDFEAQSESAGFCFVDFYDEAGNRNYADNYSSVYPSPNAHKHHSVVFMARADAIRGVIAFKAFQGEIELRNVSVQPISKSEALEWMHAIHAELPPLKPQLDTARWELLPHTRNILRNGGLLRLVALGDSISNDMVNGLGHLLIEEAYPGVTIESIHANGPEKSAYNYQKDEALQRLVIPHKPALLTVAGMSHDPESVQNIIRKVREACGPVDAVYFDVRVDHDPNPQERLARLKEIQSMGKQDEFAVWDMTTPYQEALQRASNPPEWFQRDSHHVNDKGKQVLGQLFAAYFTL